MNAEMRPGSQVVYQGSLAKIVEICGHDALLVDGGEAGVLRVNRGEVIPLNLGSSSLDKITVARIPNEAWEKAERRASVIRQLLASSNTLANESVRTAADDLGITIRHLWRLIGSYRANGSISGLVLGSGGRIKGARVLDRGVERVIAQQIEEFHLKPERPTVKSLVERVQAECRTRRLPVPAYATVVKRLDAYNNRSDQCKRMGAKAARYKFEPMPYHVEVGAALERVEIDHTPMDVMVRSDDPLCSYVGRPWLTVAIDVYTRCVLGIHIGFEPPSILSVALCLTHAVLPKVPASEFNVPLDWGMCGLPREIVVDNGKEFHSKAFQRGCNEYGILLSYRPVGSPHFGGTIERLIGTLVGQCHLLPGTTKNSVRAKGNYDSQKHAALTLSQARRWFVEQLLGRYHLKPHRMLRIPPKLAWERAVQGSAGGN